MNYSIKIRQLSSNDIQLFDQVKVIYLSSFPASERQELKIFTDRFLGGQSIFFVVLEGSNNVIAMCSLFDIHLHDFVLLDYLAVKESYRNGGIGGQLFQEIKKWALENSKKIIIEVENPLFGEGKLDKKRRINFYEQHGAHLLSGTRYLLPPLDGKTIVEMNLMIVDESSVQKVSNEEIYELIEQIYQHVYRRTKDDPLLNEIKSGLNK